MASCGSARGFSPSPPPHARSSTRSRRTWPLPRTGMGWTARRSDGSPTASRKRLAHPRILRRQLGTKHCTNDGRHYYEGYVTLHAAGSLLAPSRSPADGVDGARLPRDGYGASSAPASTAGARAAPWLPPALTATGTRSGGRHQQWVACNGRGPALCSTTARGLRRRAPSSTATASFDYIHDYLIAAPPRPNESVQPAVLRWDAYRAIQATLAICRQAAHGPRSSVGSWITRRSADVLECEAELTKRCGAVGEGRPPPAA